MTELERLTERIRSAMCWGWTEPSEIAERLIEDGDVIVPPCKVGDTVWFIQSKRIYEGKVVLIRPFIHKENTNFYGNVAYECEDVFYNDGRMMVHQVSVAFHEYGQNTIAYLTREEAEAALAERRTQ